MTTVTLSRFYKGRNSYTFQDSYKGCLSNQDENCAPIQGYMDGLIAQMNHLADEPTGWSFAEWRKGTNLASNLIGAHAIILEYALDRDDTEIVQRLHDKAKALSWAFFMLDTETKNGNTITAVFPLTESIPQAQYARLASILAEELDEYGMEHGSLAATHIVHVHRMTSACVFTGRAMNPSAEIKRTAKMYQRLNARKFEGTRPRSKTTTQSEGPLEIQDGLFTFYETPKERREREALEIMAQYGFTS